MVQLSRESPAGEAEHDEHQRDGGEYSRDAPEPTLEPADRRRQNEGEQHGECDRYDHRLRPIEDADDEDTPGEYHPRFQGPGVIHEGHARTVWRKATWGCS